MIADNEAVGTVDTLDERLLRHDEVLIRLAARRLRQHRPRLEEPARLEPVGAFSAQAEPVAAFSAPGLRA